MGIVEKELASFEFTNGQAHQVELNASGTIHLHMGNTRLEMSREEFHQFTEAVLTARQRLGEEKGW